jgi:MFS family permease
MLPTTSSATARGVFRVRSYKLFWLARGFSALAYQMLGVAFGWQIYALTHSTFALGMVGLAQFLPLVLLILIVGHVADRADRGRILTICRAIEALAAAALAIANWTNHINPAAIFVAVAVVGAARAFENPSTQAMVPNLVADDLVPQAIAWASSAFQTASIIGPALGGFLYVAGPDVVYAVASLLFLAASVLMLGVRLWRPNGVRGLGTATSIFSGIHYIRDHKNILGAISLDLFAVLLGGASALFPAFAHDILHTGPWGLGLLRLSPALGALTTSVIIAHYPMRKHAGMRMFFCVIIFGLATIAFALSRSLWVSMVVLILMGGADMVSVLIRSTLVQLETPDEMRGRVSAVNTLFIGTSNQLGEFESGITASWFGLIPATILGGVGCIVVALVWMRLFPSLRKLDRLT